MNRQLDLFADASPEDLALPWGPLVSTPALARALHCSRWTVSRRVAEGAIDAFRFGTEAGAYFIPRPVAGRLLRAA